MKKYYFKYNLGINKDRITIILNALNFYRNIFIYENSKFMIKEIDRLKSYLKNHLFENSKGSIFFTGRLIAEDIYIISNSLNLYKIALIYLEKYDTIEDLSRFIEMFNENLIVEQ